MRKSRTPYSTAVLPPNARRGLEPAAMASAIVLRVQRLRGEDYH
jgi:hypothetical protein